MQKNTIGIILAGGASRRMGADKAGLLWRGRSFLDCMLALLDAAGVERKVVLGRDDHPLGVLDRVPDQGPGAALSDFMNSQPVGTRFLVVPVDMPYLGGDILTLLLASDRSLRLEGEVLPALFVRGEEDVHFDRLRDILTAVDADEAQVTTDMARRLRGCNTPGELAAIREMFENPA